MAANLCSFITNSDRPIEILSPDTSSAAELLSSDAEIECLKLVHKLPDEFSARFMSTLKSNRWIRSLVVTSCNISKPKPQLVRAVAAAINPGLERLEIRATNFSAEDGEVLGRAMTESGVSLRGFAIEACHSPLPRGLCVWVGKVQSLESLSISNTLLGGETSRTIVEETIAKLPMIQEVLLRYTNIAPDVGRPLGLVMGRLRTLDLRSNCLRDLGIEALIGGFLDGYSSSRGCTLETLNLSRSQISLEGFVKLPQLLAHTTRLRSLDISWNYIGDEASPILGEAIGRLRALEELMAIACHLRPGFFRGMRKARALVRFVADYNELGDAGAKELAGYLMAGPSRIAHLSLNINMITQSGTKELVKALARIGTLSFLDLSQNSLGSENASALFDSFVRPMEELKLARCEIGDKGAKALARAISRGGFRRLTLDCNQIGAEGIAAVAEAIAAAGCIETLSLTSNFVGTSGAIMIAEKIVKPNRTMESLDINYMDLGAEGARALAIAVREMRPDSALRRLIVGGKDCGEPGVRAIRDACARRVGLDLAVY